MQHDISVEFYHLAKKSVFHYVILNFWALLLIWNMLIVVLPLHKIANVLLYNVKPRGQLRQLRKNDVSVT